MQEGKTMSHAHAFIDRKGSESLILTPIQEQSSSIRELDGLQICTFGSIQVRLAGVTLSFVRRKAVALLVYLAATRRTHTRDALSNLLWGSLPQARACANLRKVISELREQVNEALIIT